MGTSPAELRDRIRTGLLSFPVTHATANLTFDASGYAEHIAWLGSHHPAALFAAGGTGEIFSLTTQEVDRVVRTAVEAAPPQLPIIGPAGYGTATAVAMTRAADQAGVSGIFLCPPYLTEVSQEGLVEHVRTVCASTELGVIVYHRANARFTADSVARLAETCPNFVGFKDGTGAVELLMRLAATLGDRLALIGGLPTAELHALSYGQAGASSYSSAIFNFAPRWAKAFYRAVSALNAETVHRMLREFVLPYVDIRDRAPGYAVSIVKGGLTAVGRPAGPVRPPLTDLSETELAELTALIEERMHE